MAELRSTTSENDSMWASNSSRWPWQEVIVFIVFALTILIASWPLIDGIHYEVGDFAANGLLIQKAKVANLWVGNYSRIGVNHPGPAILYVLALGELVLFDWTHLLPSPFSGQMIAAILYNAFWISLIFGMLKRLSGSLGFSIISAGIFLYVTARLHFQFFSGMWFPELYFFPFAAMLLAVARFASGKTDMLLSLAFSAGFLINGHVSFVSTLGIIFFLSIAYNLTFYRNSNGVQCIFERAYWQANRGRIMRASILLMLFFVPLIVETIRHFPGPIAIYARFGHSHQANTIEQATRYAGHYWGRLRWFVIGFLSVFAIFFYAIRKRSTLFYENICAIFFALIAATMAMLFYSKFGVDFLGMDYMGYFYYSVPALTAGMIVGCVWSIFDVKQWWITVVVAAILLCLVYKSIDEKPIYVNQYNQPDVVDIYNLLLKNKSNGRLVLDLDNRSDYEHIWSTVLGAELYAARHGVDLFCINKNWALAFTVEAQCSPFEVTHNKKIVVSAATLDNELSPIGRISGIALYRYPDSFNGKESFSVKTAPNLFEYFFLEDGWSPVESEFVWMQSREAHLLVKVGKGSVGTLQLDLSAFLPRPDSMQRVSIYIDDTLVSEIKFDATKNRQMVVVPWHDPMRDAVDVKLVDHDIVSPKAVGMSDDPRTLGVALYGVAVFARDP